MISVQRQHISAQCSRFFVIILVTFLAPFLSGAQTGGKYSISGNVINGVTGATLSRSSVSLELALDGSQIASTMSDDNGRFQLSNLPANRYILRASRRGFLTSAYDVHDNFTTALVTGEGQHCCDNLQMRLVPGGTIEGVVAEDSGDPVERARLTLYRESNRTGSERVQRVRTVNVDDTGSYELTGLEPGNYFLAVNAEPWYALRARGLHLASHALDGSVNSDTGSTHSPFDVVYATTFYPDTTDEGAAEPIPIKGGERFRVNFALHPVPAVHLTVHMPPQLTGRQDTFFTPQIQQQAFGLSEPVSNPVFMRNQSQMEISLAPGNYEVRMPGWDNALARQTSIDLTADQTLNLSDAGKSLVDVAGKLALSSGEALPENMFVSLQTIEGGRVGGERPDKNGSFIIHNVPPGTYQLNISGPGRHFHVSKLVATDAQASHGQITVGSSPVTFAATVYPERGLVVSGYAKRDGIVVPGAMIVLVPDDPADKGDYFRRAQSDSDGNFVLKSVEPGKYTVVAIQDGWTLDWAEPETIRHYLPQGQLVNVPENGPQTTLVSTAVEVQNK